MSAPSGETIALEPLAPPGPRKRKKKRKQKNPEETEIPINTEDNLPQSMWIAENINIPPLLRYWELKF